MLPMKLRPGAAVARQPLVDLDQLRGALRRLLAVGQQRDPRRGDAHHRDREGRAHVGELDEVLRPAADVGADVEQEDGTAAGDRDRQRERRPVDAAVALEVEQPGGQRRAGRAAGDERVRRAPRRRRAPPARSMPRASSARRMPGPRPSRSRPARRSPRRRRRPGRPGSRREQEDPDAARRGQRRARSDLSRAEIGSVAVDGNRHHRWRRPSRARSGRPRSRRGPCSCRRSGRHGAAAGGCGTGGRRWWRARGPCALNGAWWCASETVSAWGRPWARRLAARRRRAIRPRAKPPVVARSAARVGRRRLGASSARSEPASFRFAPQSGHSPAQSGRQRSAAGSASASASRAHPARSRTPAST